MREITEEEAIRDMIGRMCGFRSNHGKKALQSAIENGAFHVHPDYGDMTYVFKDKEYDHDTVEIPLWILDMFSIVAEEDIY